MIRTTAKQRAGVLKALGSTRCLENEKVWTYLVASVLDQAVDQRPYLEILCGESVPFRGQHLDPWFEAQPLSPRLGKRGKDHEANSKIDLALGAIARRGDAMDGNGIGFDPAAPASWACFVEAKFLSDCACKIRNDLYRNQLERDIESLLCFQAGGRTPDRLYFTLLTPRKFKERPRTRLYGYRMEEYGENRDLLVQDILNFATPGRRKHGQVYPDIRTRAGVLKITWATYEDILEPALGQRPVDTLVPESISALRSWLEDIAAGLRTATFPPADG
jgi:hypothetical protein